MPAFTPGVGEDVVVGEGEVVGESVAVGEVEGESVEVAVGDELSGAGDSTHF